MSPNARWYIADNEIYHVVIRGNNRMQTFSGDQDFLAYLELVKKYKQKFPLLLFHYCLMPNHIHLLLKLIHAEDLKKFIQGLSQSYSNYYRRAYGYTGHVWQGRYKSFHIEKDSYLLECGRYIERNPVRAGLVKDPTEWSWSSYHSYAHGEADPLLDPYDFYLDFGDTYSTRQGNYRQYVLEERPYEALVDRHFDISEEQGVRQQDAC